MSSNVRTSTATDSVNDVMDLMGREQVRRIPVIDERGSLVGIISQADIVLGAKDDKRAEKTVAQISQPTPSTRSNARAHSARRLDAHGSRYEARRPSLVLPHDLCYDRQGLPELLPPRDGALLLRMWRRRRGRDLHRVPIAAHSRCAVLSSMRHCGWRSTARGRAAACH
jgi:hypothetical protein